MTEDIKVEILSGNIKWGGKIPRLNLQKAQCLRDQEEKKETQKNLEWNHEWHCVLAQVNTVEASNKILSSRITYLKQEETF